MENSVDPSSKSTAHAGAGSVIVERVDMEFRRITSTSRVFALGNCDIRDQLRRACQEGTSDVVEDVGHAWIGRPPGANTPVAGLERNIPRHATHHPTTTHTFTHFKHFYTL